MLRRGEGIWIGGKHGAHGWMRNWTCFGGNGLRIRGMELELVGHWHDSWRIEGLDIAGT